MSIFLMLFIEQFIGQISVIKKLSVWIINLSCITLLIDVNDNP